MPKYYADTSIGYSRAHGPRLHSIIVPYCILVDAKDRDAAIAYAHEECRHRAHKLEHHDPSFFTLVERLKEVTEAEYGDEELFMQWRDAYADEDYIWHRRTADGKTKILPLPERKKPNYVPMSQLTKHGFKEIPLDQMSEDLREELEDSLTIGSPVSDRLTELLDKILRPNKGLH